MTTKNAALKLAAKNRLKKDELDKKKAEEEEEKQRLLAEASGNAGQKWFATPDTVSDDAVPSVPMEQSPNWVMQDPPEQEVEAPLPQSIARVPEAPKAVEYAKIFGQDTGDLKKIETGSYDEGREAEGGEKIHKGVDLAVPIGTPVMSIADGTVTRVGDVFDPNAKKWKKGSGYGDPYVNGNHIQVTDSSGRVFSYLHLNSQPVLKVGDKVTAGQQIGSSGNTGYWLKGGVYGRVGSHLHLEVRDPSLVSSTNKRGHINPWSLLEGGAPHEVTQQIARTEDGEAIGEEYLSGAVTAEQYQAMTPLERAHHKAETDTEKLRGFRDQADAARKTLQSSTRNLRITREAELALAQREALRRKSEEDDSLAKDAQNIYTSSVEVRNARIAKGDAEIADLVSRRKNNPWAMFGFVDRDGKRSAGRTAFTLAAGIGLIANAFATFKTAKKRNKVPFIAADLVKSAINMDLGMQQLEIQAARGLGRELSESARVAMQNGKNLAEQRVLLRNARFKAIESELNKKKNALGLPDLVLTKGIKTGAISIEDLEVVRKYTKKDGSEGSVTEKAKEVKNISDAFDLFGTLVNLHIAQENHQDLSESLKGELDIRGMEKELATSQARADEDDKRRAHAELMSAGGPKARQKRLSDSQKDSITTSREVIRYFMELKDIIRDTGDKPFRKLLGESVAMWDTRSNPKKGEEMNSWLLRLEYYTKNIESISVATDLARAIEIKTLVGAMIKRLIEPGNLNEGETLEGRANVPLWGDPERLAERIDEILDRLGANLGANYMGGTDQDRHRMDAVFRSLPDRGKYSKKAKLYLNELRKGWQSEGESLSPEARAGYAAEKAGRDRKALAMAPRRPLGDVDFKEAEDKAKKGKKDIERVYAKKELGKRYGDVYDDVTF